RGRAVLGGVALAQFTAASEDVRFGFHAFAHVWVVEFERGSVGADSGNVVEVVSGWWARRGPLQRVAVPPGVVDGDDFAVVIAGEDVPEEREHGDAESEG